MFLTKISDGYAEDKWVRRLADTLWDSVAKDCTSEKHDSEDIDINSVDALTALRCGWLDEYNKMGIVVRAGLLYVGDRMVIPRIPELRETLFRLAHDSLGYFSGEKSYAALRPSYYWPNMWKELKDLYDPSCEHCQRCKHLTHKPAGPLHPLPVPDSCGQCIAIDFIGLLPEDKDFNTIAAISDRLGADFRPIRTQTNISAEDFAPLFFKHWYCKNGLPLNIVSDRDKLFISRFWKALNKLTSVKLKMSTSFHPETNGSSECFNKTVIQLLRFHVERNQMGWSRALPLICFNYMNTLNASTSYTPFQLHLGRSPRIIPPMMTPATKFGPPTLDAAKFLTDIETDTLEAQDNLLLAKSNQAAHADRH